VALAQLACAHRPAGTYVPGVQDHAGGTTHLLCILLCSCVSCQICYHCSLCSLLHPAAGPMLPHLDACSSSVQHLAATATQLRSLSLSRYQVGSTNCISHATQLTALTLQHCGLADDSLAGLQLMTQLQRLELSDNMLTSGSCQALCHLTQLTHLDLR
jgi:hypothetical protein